MATFNNIEGYEVEDTTAREKCEQLQYSKADKMNEHGGFSAGDTSFAQNGGAIGEDAETSDGFAGGKGAKTVNAESERIDAIQLGTGTNPNEKTLQVYDYQLMDANGQIPNERLSDEIVNGSGYTFTPSVSEDGVISWTNDGDLENPTPTNIKGAKGDRGLSGVYVGSGDMPSDCNVQIDPSGSTAEVDDLTNYVEQLKKFTTIDLLGKESQSVDGYYVNENGQNILADANVRSQRTIKYYDVSEYRGWQINYTCLSLGWLAYTISQFDENDALLSVHDVGTGKVRSGVVEINKEAKYIKFNYNNTDDYSISVVSNISETINRINEINLKALKMVIKDVPCTKSVTGGYINVNGDEIINNLPNRQINHYDVSQMRGDIFYVEYLSLGYASYGVTQYDANGNMLENAQVGTTERMVCTTKIHKNASLIKVSFNNSQPLTMYIFASFNDKSSLDTPTNQQLGFYLPHKNVMLSGASIASRSNGYFEYAMQSLNLNAINTSVPSSNIFYLCNLLYMNSYDDVDLLIISHIHNFDVYSLPAKYNSYSCSMYESDTELGEYITTTSYRMGTVTATSNLTIDQIYAIGYDYAIKKWIERCYELRSNAEYNSVFGKPVQIILSTYWHDARTTFNESIKKLADKWSLPLIDYASAIGFSKDRVHPVTGQQWSVLYADTTGWAPTETINGVTYGFHPDRIKAENITNWDNTGTLKLEYLPYIQKKIASILIDNLKNAIID